MKKTFFMIGILATLSITAFGADPEGLVIPITGTSLAPITISSETASIDFGKVVVGKTKQSGEITLTLKGSGSEKIKLTSVLNGATDVTMVTDVPTEAVALVSGTKEISVELQYAPKTAEATLTGANLTITAVYDDADITQ